MTISSLDAQITIAGDDVTPYLIRYERNSSLEKPGATVEMTLSKNFDWSSYSPWDELVCEEQGVKTFTGFVTHIIPRRSPTTEVIVQGKDTYKRADDWFLGDNYTTDGPSGLTVGYYVGHFCDLCGLDYSILDPEGEALVIRADISLGLRPISDILVQMCGIAQWQMWVDADGVLTFDHLAPSTTPDFVLDDLMSMEEEFNDTDTRNQAKIWGLAENGVGTDGGGQILYQESRAVDGVPDVRAMLFSAPAIDDLPKAVEMATAALDQWARLEHLGSVSIIGDPNIRVGNTVQFFSSAITSGSYMDTLTDLRATLSDAGYSMNLTSGRRAYRYPYWPTTTSGSTAPIPTSGSVIFAVNGPTGHVQNISAYGDYIYLIGNDTSGGADTNWRVEKRSATSGSLIWGRTVIENPITVPNAFGVDIIADGTYVYISVRRFLLFLAKWVNQVYKLDMNTGATIPLVFPSDGQVFNTQGAFPWMAQDPDNSYIYHINGDLAVTTVAYQKPDVSDVWLTGTSIRNAIQYLNETYLIVSNTDGGVLEKLLRTDGSVDGQSLPSYLDILEIAVEGEKCYALSAIATSGSTAIWQVSRFDVGGPTDNFATLAWTISLPSPMIYIDHPSSTFFRGITSFGGGVAISLGLLSTVGVGEDGSVGAVVTESANPGDTFLCNMFYGNVLYSGGVKNNQWHIQGRGFHVDF